MKRAIIFSIILLATVVAASAQDQKSKDILNQVSEKMRSFESVSADFIFTMENEEMEIHEENEGSIQLKGQKYLVNLPDIGVKVYSDGNAVWNYMEDGNQVTITSIDSESSELMNPSSLFNIYEKGFKSKYIGEKTIEGNVYHEIELYPDEDEHNVSKISLFIDKSDTMLQSATLHGTDGNLYGINIRDMKTDLDLPDEYFEFDESEYDDIEVIDWR